MGPSLHLQEILEENASIKDWILKVQLFFPSAFEMFSSAVTTELCQLRTSSLFVKDLMLMANLKHTHFFVLFSPAGKYAFGGPFDSWKLPAIRANPPSDAHYVSRTSR